EAIEAPKVDRRPNAGRPAGGQTGVAVEFVDGAPFVDHPRAPVIAIQCGDPLVRLRLLCCLKTDSLSSVATGAHAGDVAPRPGERPRAREAVVTLRSNHFPRHGVRVQPPIE